MLVLMVSLSALIGVNVGLVLGFLIFNHKGLRSEPTFIGSLPPCQGRIALPCGGGA